MNYIYDIYLNFNKIAYDFFDWNKNDAIVHIKKIPLIKVSTSKFNKIVNNKFKIDSCSLNFIKNKTKIYENTNILKYCTLISDNYNIIAVNFNDLGISIKKSFLLINEELDILEFIEKFKEKKVKIDIISKENQPLKTRYDVYKECFIKDELKCINKDKLSYIYYECFNKKESNQKKIIKKIKSIKKNSDNYKTLYNILKLTSSKKNI